MSIWRTINRLLTVETKSLSNPDDALLALFGATPTAAGASVTPRTAMRCTPVRCAVQAIAEAAGQLPVHVFKRGDDGSKQRDSEHPAYAILHDNANPWTAASDLREQLTRDALLWGNGYAYIVMVDGKPRELIRLSPEAVKVAADPASGEPLYLNGNTPMPRESVLHIRAPGCDGIQGDSPVTQGREAIGVALVLEEHAGRLFGAGGRPSGVLTVKGASNANAIGNVREAWLAAHGPGKSGNTAILSGESTFTPITLNSVDSQFLEMRQLQIAEIARLFRVPPILLQDYGRATWSNAEAMGEQFLTYCLLPWIKRWEGEIRLKLFTPDERKSYFAEFLIDDLLRADFAQRMEGYSKAIAARILSPNEARAAENRPPYAGGERFENPNTTSGQNGPA